MTIILFAVAAALITGVIVPVLQHARETGEAACQRGEQAGIELESILN